MANTSSLIWIRLLKFRKVFGYRKFLLSRNARRYRNSICRSETEGILTRIIRNTTSPTKKSFLLAAALPTSFFVASQWTDIHTRITSGDFSIMGMLSRSRSGNDFQGQIAIHSGIGVIIFALVVFVAESMRDAEARDKAGVLLRESFLFPLTVAEILTFYTFMGRTPNLLNMIPVVIIGLLTIYSLSRVILVLMSTNRFAVKRSQFLKERFRGSLGKAIEERVANNLLMSKLHTQEILLRFNYFVQAGEPSQYDFVSKRLGTVVDINLHALKRFGEILDEEAIRNGYSFKSVELPVPSYELRELPGETSRIAHTQNDRRYLVKKYHDRVTENSKVLISVDKGILRDSGAIRLLESIVVEAFRIDSKNSFTDDMQADISALSDQIMNSIRDMKYGEISELMDLYLDLAVEFLDTVSACQGAMSSEDARKERHSIYSGWPQVGWLKSGVMNFFRVAFRTKDIEAIEEIMFLPMSIALRAIEKDDHFIFQEFVEFARIGYELAWAEPDKEVREHSVDRSWRFITEISRYYIEGRMLQGNIQSSRMKNLKDFGIEVFVIFAGLMKSSFDKGDFESFSEFVDTVSVVMKEYETHETNTDSYTLKDWLKDPQLTQEERRRLELELENQILQDGWKNEIRSRREQMFFGMASWILASMVNREQNFVDKRFYKKVAELLPGSLIDLTNVFLLTHDFIVEEFWGWRQWGMEADGKVREVHVLRDLEVLYAVRALTLLEMVPAADASDLRLPHSRDLRLLAEGSRDLMSVLDSIRDEPTKWEQVLSQDAIMNVELFRNLLKKAGEAQSVEELNFVRIQPISMERVEEFKLSFIAGFRSEIFIRDLFERYQGLEVDLSGVANNVNYRFGIDTLDDKEAFINNSPVRYVEWGSEYGRNFARSENRNIFELIADKCGDVTQDRRTVAEVLEEVGEVEHSIVVSGNVSFSKYFRGVDSYVSKWTQGVTIHPGKGWDGYLIVQGISVPLFRLNVAGLPSQLLILNTRKLGLLRQRSPLISQDEREKMRGIFLMDVAQFYENEPLLTEFLTKPPTWLLEKGDREAQRSYLEGRVRIQIYEDFVHDSIGFTGRKILVGEID